MTHFVWIMFTVISVIVAAFPNLVFGIVKLVALYRKHQVKYRPYGIATIVLLCIWVLLFAYGMIWGRFRYEVTHLDYSYDGPSTAIPQGFDGYRIVVISDLHLDGWKGHEKKLQEVINTINSQKPDLIFFTGDLVSLSEDEVNGFESLLRKIKAKDGVIAIMGNHDYLPYDEVPPIRTTENREPEIRKLERVVSEDIGWKLLLNDNTIIHHNGDSIAILGCENQSMGKEIIVARGDLKKAMKGTNGMFRILLTHDPSHWDGEVVGKTDIPLTVSGHTHGGQVNICGLCPAKLFMKRVSGLYSQGNQMLYVNIGLGAAMPMRLGATPEITVITLHK